MKVIDCVFCFQFSILFLKVNNFFYENYVRIIFSSRNNSNWRFSLLNISFKLSF